MARNSAAVARRVDEDTVEVGRRDASVSTKSGKTVVVCSKLEMALELQLCEVREERRQDRSTVWFEKVSYKVGKVYVINGTAQPRGAAPEGCEWPEPPQIKGGFAMTFGIPKDFWEKWLAQNEKTPFVENGLIFAHERRDHAIGEAKEKKDLQTGFGPLKPVADGPQTDPRMPKKLGNPMSGVRRGNVAEDEMAEAYEDAEVL